MLNGPFATHITADGLKTAIIRPVDEKGAKNSVEDCRPTSLLPALAIIMEKLNYVRVYTEGMPLHRAHDTHLLRVDGRLLL